MAAAIAAVGAVRATEPGAQTMIQLHKGLGQASDWRVDQAQSEALADIRQGHLKIYLGDSTVGEGGPAGIPFQLAGLLTPCTFVDPGFTDVIGGDEEVARRKRQHEYARIYNQTIVRYLLVENGQPASRLEEALADKAGSEAVRDQAIREAVQRVEEIRKKKAGESADRHAPEVDVRVVRLSPDGPLITLGHHDPRSYIDVVFLISEPEQYRGRKLRMRFVPEFTGKLFDRREFCLRLPLDAIDGSARETKNPDGVTPVRPGSDDYWNFEAVLVAAIPEPPPATRP